MANTHPLYARVILDSPLPQLDHLFDYLVPESLIAEIRVGQQVRVPLRGGKRRSDAYIVELTQQTDFPGSLSALENIVSPVPVLPPQLYDLARAVADRQAGSISDVLRLCIPTRYVRVEKAFLEQHANYLADVTALNKKTSASQDTMTGVRRYVAELGGVEKRGSVWAPRWVHSFVDRAQPHIHAGKSVLCVVPDFRDVAYVEAALADTSFKNSVVRIDGDMPSSARWSAYLRILSGEPLIVVGKRSAIYAPVPTLGMVFMWNDGDDSFDEPHAPYAHARDVALIRQTLTGCDLVFSSFAPSTSVARLIKISYLDLEHHHVSRPKIHPTDLDSLSAQQTHQIPSLVFGVIREALAQGSVLVHVAKPGFASTTRCASCRERARCSSCAGPLRLGSRGSAPTCGWCGRMHPAYVCPHCGSSELRPGMGGQIKIGEELGRAFPGARVIITDPSQAAPDVPPVNALVVATPGTEPLAPHGYRAVILLDGEITRSREDLDSEVQALSAWLTAASFSADDARIVAVGTGPLLGRVLATGEWSTFVMSTLDERAQLGLPPTVRCAVIEGPTGLLPEVRKELEELPLRGVLGPTTAREDRQRLIVLFDYRHGARVSAALRALIVRSAQHARKVIPSHSRDSAEAGRASRVARLTVRMDDTALGHLDA